MYTFPLCPHMSSYFFFLPLADFIGNKSKETNMSPQHWSCLSVLSSITRRKKKCPKYLFNFKWLFSMKGGIFIDERIKSLSVECVFFFHPDPTEG